MPKFCVASVSACRLIIFDVILFESLESVIVLFDTDLHKSCAHYRCLGACLFRLSVAMAVWFNKNCAPL